MRLPVCGGRRIDPGLMAETELLSRTDDTAARSLPANVEAEAAFLGAVLIDNPAIAALVEQLFPRVDIITPNLDEASLLVGRTLQSEQDMQQAAHQLQEMGAAAVLLKGGHLQGDTVSDLFLSREGQTQWLRAPRIHSHNTHGTGCTLSSAIASHMALGHSLTEAIAQAHRYIRQALQSGAAVRTGHGSGPLNHLSTPVPMHLRPLNTSNESL